MQDLCVFRQVESGGSVSVLLRGESGSGKSFTLFGPSIYSSQDQVEMNKKCESDGILLKALDQLFEGVTGGSVRLGACEVDQAKCVDLIATADCNATKTCSPVIGLQGSLSTFSFR